MCQRMKNQEDVESGWYMYGDELSSIRVDPSYASAAVPIPPPPPPQEYYIPVSYQSSGKNICTLYAYTFDWFIAVVHFNAAKCNLV